jgi:hypothetical protein
MIILSLLAKKIVRAKKIICFQIRAEMDYKGLLCEGLVHDVQHFHDQDGTFHNAVCVHYSWK